MSWFRLSSLSVGSMSTTILLGLISGYLLTLRRKTPDTWYLSGYLGVLFVLLLSYAVRYSLFSAAGLYTGQFSNLIVFGVVCLIQFAYHFGGNIYVRESRILLYLSLTAALVSWGSLFFRSVVPAVYDFEAEYFSFEYGPRIGAVTLIGYLWAISVMVRKTVLFSGGAIFASLIRPVGRKARSTRSFALLTLATTVLSLLYLLFQTEIISRYTYSFVFNTGALLICLLIFIVYVSNAAQPVSFLTKLVGIPMAAILVTFGIVANALSPVLSDSLSRRYSREAELAVSAVEAADYRIIPKNVVYVASEPEDLLYLDPAYSIDSFPITDIETVDQGLLFEGGQAGFLYLDLYDPDSFFFYIETEAEGALYQVGFRYTEYRLSIHRFWAELMIFLFLITFFVLILFPIVFESSLLRPLRALLSAVHQVETGNYRLVLPVASEDEIGKLALGYNSMVASLRDAEGNFKALAENANDAILLLSKEGRIVYANSRAAQMSGYSEAALRGKHIREFVPAHELAKVEERFSARMNGRPAAPCYETEIVVKPDRPLPVEVSGARTTWHNEPANVVVLRDISERKATEELLRVQQQRLMQADKLASIGMLVSGVAHEVNNPNQVVTLNARFLAEGLPTLFKLVESGEGADESLRIAGLPYSEFKTSVESSLTEIEGSAKRVDYIVGELKGFVRDQAASNIVSIDINEVVRVVVDMSRHLIRQATNRFRLNLGEELPCVMVDRIKIEQVVLNLVQNACQALTDKNEGLEISTRFDADDRSIIVKVRDEGIGIPEVDLARISAPFFTTKRESGGTGLGLSVSERIVKNHGGTLAFRSQPGKGTTAEVRLPVASV